MNMPNVFRFLISCMCISVLMISVAKAEDALFTQNSLFCEDIGGICIESASCIYSEPAAICPGGTICCRTLAISAFATTTATTTEYSTTTTETATTTKEETTTTSTTTTTTSTTTTTTSTTTQTEYLEGGMIPVQVEYADDVLLWPSNDPFGGKVSMNDLGGNSREYKLLSSLSQIKDKSTGFVGTKWNNYVAQAEITAGSTQLVGKFKIEITNAEPSVYESEETFVVEPGKTLKVDFNPHDSNGAVTAIPFVPGSSPFVPGTSNIHWGPLKYLKFKSPGTSEIKVKFGDVEISKTIVESIIETVPFRIEWKGMVLPGQLRNKELVNSVAAEAKTRASGMPALFIKANYPVENPKFKPTYATHVPHLEYASKLEVSLDEWKNVYSERIRIFLLMREANMRSLPLKKLGIDRQVIVVPPGILYKDNQIIQGISCERSKVVYVTQYAEPCTDAHEIAHTMPFGLDDDYDIPIADGYNAEGYLATIHDPDDASPLMGPTWPARPYAASAKSLGFMGTADDTKLRIARKDHYKHFINAFDAASNTEVDPHIWMLRGMFETQNSTIDVAPIYQFDSTVDKLPECGTNGNCTTLTVRITLQDNSIIDKTAPVSTGVFAEDLGFIPTTFGPIAATFEMPTQPVRRINILNGTNVLFEKNVSQNAPVLTIVRPREDRKFKGGKIRLLIMGTDADNDPLFASVFIENKDGTFADDVAQDIPLTNNRELIPVDADGMPAGNYTISVLLTDGFNTAEQEVDVEIV
jgi:hypothetical protein